MICQHYVLECVSDRPVETQPGTVMRPAGGMLMTIRERGTFDSEAG